MREYPKYDPPPFRLIVRIDGQNRRFTVQQTLRGIGEEHYEVRGRNKTIKFSTNRPIIERRGLKDFPWTWKLIEGELVSASAREAIIEALENHLRGKKGPGGGLYRA